MKSTIYKINVITSGGSWMRFFKNAPETIFSLRIKQWLNVIRSYILHWTEILQSARNKVRKQ